MLTNRQLTLLSFIYRFICEKGIPPTHNEMSTEIKSGPAAVDALLNRLEERGFIKREKYYSRRIAVLKMPMRVFVPEDGKMVHAGQVVVTHVG